jgi:hypothetical protein
MTKSKKIMITIAVLIVWVVAFFQIYTRFNVSRLPHYNVIQDDGTVRYAPLARSLAEVEGEAIIYGFASFMGIYILFRCLLAVRGHATRRNTDMKFQSGKTPSHES